MQVAFLGGAAGFFAAGSAIDIAASGSERFENRVEVLDDVVFAANHLAVTALEAPDAAAGADVNVVDAFGGELLGAADVVDVVGVAAVDDDVADVELAAQFVERGVHHPCGNHKPDGARLVELLDEVVERSRTGGAFTGELLYGFGAAIVDHALVPVFLQAPHHVGTHPAQSDHPKLHCVRSSVIRLVEN